MAKTKMKQSYVYYEDDEGMTKLHLKKWKVSQKNTFFSAITFGKQFHKPAAKPPMKIKGEIDFIEFESWKWYQRFWRWLNKKNYSGEELK